jgi:Tfp pilus assembly protein PilX
VDKEARESLLRLATYLLADIERFVLPQALKAGNPIDASRWFSAAELQLKSAEEQLTRAQDMVSKYGPSLRVIGG